MAPSPDLFIRIEGSAGGGEPLTVPVEDGLTFGRSKENRCRIRDEEVSRFHAKVVREKESWLLVEVNAKNPVVVRLRNEEFRLRDRGRCALVPGLEFTLGPIRCFVVEGREPATKKRPAAAESAPGNPLAQTTPSRPRSRRRPEPPPAAAAAAPPAAASPAAEGASPPPATDEERTEKEVKPPWQGKKIPRKGS